MSPRTVIVLTGPHGAGKSGHVDTLAAALRERGVDAQAFHYQPPPETVRGAFARALWYAAQRDAFRLDAPCADVIVVPRWHESTVAAASRARAHLSAVQMFELVAMERQREEHADLRVVTLYLHAPADVLDARLTKRDGRPQTAEERSEARWFESDEFAYAAAVDTARPREVVAAEILAHALRALGRGE